MRVKKNTFLILASIAVVALTCLFVFLFSPGISSSVIDSIPTDPPDISGADGNGGQASNNPDYSKIDITRENVQSVIRAMARPSDYYYETESVLAYSGGSSAYARKKWAHGAWERVDILSDSSTVTMHIIYGGGNVFMWRPGATRYYKTNAGEFTADDSQMMMVYEDVLHLDPSNILDAKYTLYNGTPCIYVEANNPVLGYRERYWISTENGLLILGQTLKDSTVIYTVRSKVITVAAQDESLFQLPTGESAMNV